MSDMKDWELDDEKKYLWRHKTRPIELMRFRITDSEDFRCVYIRFLHDDDWLSNYFLYDEETQKVTAKDFALEMVDRFLKTKEVKNGK